MDLETPPTVGPLIAEGLRAPLYQQVYLALRERILSGDLPAGSLLAGEQEMAKSLSVSRITVKRAFNELAARGLVHRRRGRGTTVADNPVIPLVAAGFDTLMESLQRMGLQTELELLDVADVAAGAYVAERLEIDPSALVQRAVRLRRLGAEPFSHVVSYVPAKIAEDFSREDLATTPMLTLLERVGATPREAEQWISAVAAPAPVAARLGVDVGAPLLRIERVMRGPGRRPVQTIEAHYQPNRFHYHFRTRRNDADAAAWRIDG